jgi:hypothetical protein
VPIYEPGLDELLRAERRAAALHARRAEAIEGAEFVFVAVGTPPTYSGDADLSAVWTVVDELPRSRARRRRDEEHRAGRAPARGSATASTSVGSAGRLRLQPEFTAEGHCDPGTSSSPTAS